MIKRILFLQVLLSFALVVWAEKGVEQDSELYHGLFRDPVPSCDDCSYELAESIPYGLNGTLSTSLYTAEAWMDLIEQARESINIACFYMTLNDSGSPIPEGYGHEEGLRIFEALIAAGKRGVDVKIAINQPTADMPSPDVVVLQEMGIAEVRYVNVSHLLDGVLHTKFLIADNSSFYVGSANMDWRSLTQVKELGIKVDDCPCLAEDLLHTWFVYWEMGELSVLPDSWPVADRAFFNYTRPAYINFNSTEPTAEVYMTSSPWNLCPEYRSVDIDSLIYTIKQANETISIEVMDYLPCTEFVNPNFYWPDIDDALREAAFNRQVNVSMLISWWNHSDPQMSTFLSSLDALDYIEVKLFEMPLFGPDPIPYTRVNHAKFMVTEKTAYIMTSNWSGDYFINTAGVSFSANSTNIVSNLQARFDRDWNSPYAANLPPCQPFPSPIPEPLFDQEEIVW